MSFEPKKTDVDEHIDLINTLGDMVDQKEEAKMEKFIEKMLTMIQTHLIICENWADITDKAKSLKHIIQKCNPPTLAMPLVTTGATVPGLYSHIAHSVDKQKEVLHHLKGQNQSKSEVEVNQKGNLRVLDRTHLKPKRQRKPTVMIALITITTMIITLPQVQIEAADLLTVKAVTGNLEASRKEAEAKDLSITNAKFKIIDLREAHLNITVINMALTANPIFREIKQITTEDKGVAGFLSKLKDTVMVGPITRVTMALTSISIIHMISRQNSMAHPVVYAVVSIIPLSTATKENMT